MATLSDTVFESLLSPYLQAPLPGISRVVTGTRDAPLEALIPVLGVYLDLLLRWNERTNLTAIRNPEQIVQRHFGESLFAARVLACKLEDGAAVLDVGSGAGFPGLPIQLFLPHVAVTLAESQGKKCAFLREAARETGATAEIWPARAQELPASRRFHAVTMRAVDKPSQALAEGHKRLVAGGYLLQFGGVDCEEGETIAVPGLDSGVIRIARK